MESSQKAKILFTCGIFAASVAPTARALAQENSAPFADESGYFVAPGSQMPEEWAGIRSLGMGNAYTSSSNDELAVFANPAGLARSRNPRKKSNIHELSLPGMVIGGNQASVSALRKSPKPQTWAGKLFNEANQKPQTPHYFEAQAYPYFTFGGKGSPTYLLGLPTRSVLLLQSGPQSNGSPLMIFSENTATVAAAMGGSVRSGLISWGISARPNMRYTVFSSNFKNKFNTSTLNTKSLATLAKSHAVKTIGTGLDAGILLTAADYWFPTFAVAVRNISTGCKKDYVSPISGKTITMCGTLRSKSSGSLPIDTSTQKPFLINSVTLDPTEIRAGFSITPRGRIGGTKVNLKLAAEAYPIPVKSGSQNYGIPDVPVGRLIHAGGELFFGNAITDRGFGLRGGIMNSLPTFGATVNFFAFSLELAHYSQVVGTRNLSQSEKRYLAGLSVEL